MAVNDSLLLLAQGRAGVTVYRLEGLGGVEFVRNINSTAVVFAFDVAMSGDHGYIAWGTAGLHVVDLRRLHVGSGFVGALQTDFAAKAVAIAGSYALISQLSKLEIADVRSPAAPVLVGVAPVPGNPASLTVFATTAYVSGGSDGVQLINIADSANPIPSGTINLGGTIMGVDADELFLYAVDQDNGLIVTGVQCE